MFLFLFFNCILTVPIVCGCKDEENVSREIKLNQYTDKIEKLLLDQVSSVGSKSSESIMFCISVPKNKSLEVINAMKKLLYSKKNENEIFYYREISKFCDDIYQGFDRTIEFIDEFLDFSLFYKKYPSNNKINEFNRHSFSFAIKFSDTENLNDIYLNNVKYDTKINEDDSKNIPDLFMITDLSESYENYLILRERMQEDINSFYSSPELIFADSFKTFRKTDPIKLDTIIKLFFNYSFVMKDNKMWQFFFKVKFEDLNAYFINSLKSTRDELEDYKKNVKGDSYSLLHVYEKNNEINYLKNIVHFFKKVLEEEWIEALNSIKNYIEKKDNVHIFCALNNKNAEMVTDHIKTLYTEISTTFDDPKKMFFSVYTFKKNFIHNKDKKNIANSYSKLVYKYENLQNTLIKMDLSIVFIKTSDSFSRLFLWNDTIHKFNDVVNSMDNPISNENEKILVNDWILVFKNLDLSNFNEVEIYTIKPYKQKYVDVDIFQWVDHQIKNLIEKDDFLIIYRRQLLSKLDQLDKGFINYKRILNFKFARRIDFSKRDCFYSSFLTNFLNFVKINAISIEKSYITNNGMCFRPFDISKINLETFNYKEHEHLYNQRKNIIESPNNNKNLTYSHEWIRSQIEFCFLLKSKKVDTIKLICKVQLRVACRDFIVNNTLLDTIKLWFYYLVKYGKYSSIKNGLFKKIFQNSIFALTIGEADKICRILYGKNLTRKKFDEVLDFLLSKILFKAYAELYLHNKDVSIKYNLDYILKYIENIKNEILNHFNQINYKELITDNSRKIAKIEFYIDDSYKFPHLYSGSILEKLYSYEWVIDE